MNNREYLQALLDQAEAKNLSRSRYWKILLHYKQRFFGTWESEIDSLQFFVAKDGKTNPASELAATISAFFAPLVAEEVSYEHPQCRFIARFNWLKEQLAFDTSLMPIQTCRKYQDWINDLNPESLSLVFPSYYIKTPASMFGHTLLRVNTKGNDYTSLLNYAINYAANIDPAKENAIAFAVLGTFGGYPGVFSVVPYYVKIQEYNNIEQRDIWEYHLSFSRDEIIRMLKHVWELKFAYFDYFFFKENCSYHLLSLLEAARPSLHLQEGFFLWTIPGDTIRKLIAVPGLVRERTYRPSRYSMIRQKLDHLGDSEQDFLFTLISDHSVLHSVEWQAFSIQTKALILEAANDYYVMQGTPQAKKLRFHILRQRARLNYILPDRKNKSFSSLPERGHKTSRFGFAAGQHSEKKNFADAYIQPSFHNLLAFDEGYFPNSEIEFFKLRLRQYENENVILEELTLLSIHSFVPRDRIVSPLSWKFKGGFIQEKTLECDNCPVFFLNGGLGVSYQLGDGLIYSLGEGLFNYHDIYKNNHREGVGVTVGMLGTLGSNWKVNLTAAAFNMFDDIIEEFRCHIRYLLTVNADLRLEWDKIETNTETKLALNIYF